MKVLIGFIGGCVLGSTVLAGAWDDWDNMARQNQLNQMQQQQQWDSMQQQQHRDQQFMNQHRSPC